MTSPRHLVVLLVEDDNTIREITAMILEGEGHVVHTAASGEEAEHWLEKGHVADLLFTDINMPGKITGRDLALRHARMPVLVTSGETREQHAWVKAPMEYLAKPYDRKTLLAAVNRLAA